MLWVVYNTETVEIYQKFYSKKSAKEYVKSGLINESWNARRDVKNKKVDIDKVDIRRLDEWQMWKTLQAST